MNAYSDIEEEAGPGILAALPQIFWQRKWLIIVPSVLALAGGIAAAVSIPPMYQSSGTMLIESEQLQSDGGPQNVNDLIDQRIARARERVLSRKDLIRLIRANNLYADQQRSKPLSEIVDEMRDATAISAVPVDLGGGVRTVLQGSNAIALRISFSYPEPVKAQAIAQQFVNSFLEADARAQADKATGSLALLQEQQNQIANQINAIEDEISKVKTANGPIIAAQTQFTGDPAADAARIDSQIASLRADIAQRSSQGGGGDPAVAQAEAALRVAQAKFSPTHPDVIAAKAQLDAARAASTGGGTGKSNLIDPVVAANQSQIASLQQARALMLSGSAAAKSAAARAPAILDQIDQLNKKAEILREQYRAIAARVMGADMNKRVETDQKGERLTLADPPVVPDQPYKPNRPVIIVGALAAGIGVGLALTLLFELLFRPIRGSEALKHASGQSPIAIIPDFERKPNIIIRWLETRNRKRSMRGA